MMDNADDSEELLNAQEGDLQGVPSPSSSYSSSLGMSQDFRHMMKPPNKKKYEEEMEKTMQDIKSKETELKSLGPRSPEEQSAVLNNIRAEKDANISRRKGVDAELKQLNLNIQTLRSRLSATESNLQLKNEAKIDEAIRKLEHELNFQNFKLSEERKIVAEIDKYKRSKKVLEQYFAQKREFDDARAKQNRLRGEREVLHKSVTTLKNREDDFKRSRQVNKTRTEVLKKEIDELYNTKRKLFADFKQHEADYNRSQKEHKKALKRESFRKREEEKRAKEMAYRKEMLEYEAQKEPFEDEKNLCNTLMTYLQRYTTTQGEGVELCSPREEQADLPGASAAPGVADSLDDGMFVLLRKSDEADPDYSISNRRPSSKRGRKGKKQSVTKPLAHTPQIIAQFASLNLSAPSNMSEVAASIEQLQARKRFYDEHAAVVTRPVIGSLSGSFSSSGSMSSMESPLRERSSTWGFVDVPSPILENQTSSECGRSAESGFHDMSRQASKTESSESAADHQPLDHALEEIIQQSAEYDESEHSRSSSDTVTAEDHISEDIDLVLTAQSTYDCEFPQTLMKTSSPKDEVHTFQSKPNKTSPVTKDNKIQLPGNNVTSLSGNQDCERMLPSNTDNVFIDKKHPVDAGTSSDACQASMDNNVPKSVPNATNLVPIPNEDRSNIVVFKPDKMQDSLFHIGNKSIEPCHTSAMMNDPDTNTICEPQSINNPEPRIANKDGNVSNKAMENDLTSEANAYLTCDSNETCDKSSGADNLQCCDASLDGPIVDGDSAGIESIQECCDASLDGPNVDGDCAGIESIHECCDTSLDAEGDCVGKESEPDVVLCVSDDDLEGAVGGVQLEAASGLYDFVGASGIGGNIDQTAQDVDLLLEDSSI